jgi:hypothetical protein
MTSGCCQSRVWRQVKADTPNRCHRLKRTLPDRLSRMQTERTGRGMSSMRGCDNPAGRRRVSPTHLLDPHRPARVHRAYVHGRVMRRGVATAACVRERLLRSTTTAVVRQRRQSTSSSTSPLTHLIHRQWEAMAVGCSVPACSVCSYVLCRHRRVRSSPHHRR